ncbi:hypothetical protein [Burkholderia territorii]|uniref:hypothetical protein n=1 Tax=Burkholderia territorii TaxID=1503055 RepID=UPI0012D8C9AA|nr:hypothetical protein [Burkholderia territorii]
MTPDEFNPLIEQRVAAHCSDRAPVASPQPASGIRFPCSTGCRRLDGLGGDGEALFRQHADAILRVSSGI